MSSILVSSSRHRNNRVHHWMTSKRIFCITLICLQAMVIILLSTSISFSTTLLNDNNYNDIQNPNKNINLPHYDVVNSDTLTIATDPSIDIDTHKTHESLPYHQRHECYYDNHNDNHNDYNSRQNRLAWLLHFHKATWTSFTHLATSKKTRKPFMKFFQIQMYIPTSN